jgi:hypothetical protein
MKLKYILVIFGLIVLWTASPMVSVLIASGVASAFGCELDEGNVHQCFAFGHDIGNFLSTMFVMGWLFLVTIPTGLVALVALAFAVFFSRLIRKQSGMEDRPGTTSAE